jgi:hypothetical protein
MWVFLSSQHVLLKDYGKFVQRLSHEISEHGKAFAAQLGRPYQYLTSSSLSKEQLAREIMERDHIKRGLVCVFAAVEPGGNPSRRVPLARKISCQPSLS